MQPALANPTFPQHLKLRHKLAALGVVGMALLLLPLVQLLRWHGLELQWSQAAQAQLAPALLAVETQRGLVDHRQATALLLQGDSSAEVPRRIHQAVVDAKLDLLGQRLEQSYLLAARHELRAMASDWRDLVERIVGARSSVAHSNHAHRLLIEQTLQIIDNISVGHADAAPLRQAAATASTWIAAGTAAQEQAIGLLTAAKAQIEQAQAAKIALHQGHRSLAAGGLLALLAAMAGLIFFVLAGARRASHPGPLREARQDPTATPPAHWLPPSVDGQQASNAAKQSLMQRLRGPAAPSRNADPQPTQPHDL